MPSFYDEDLLVTSTIFQGDVFPFVNEIALQGLLPLRKTVFCCTDYFM